MQTLLDEETAMQAENRDIIERDGKRISYDGNLSSPTDCEEFIEELFKAVYDYIEKLDEPDKKHEWVDVVKKCKRTKRKRTDVANG